MEPDRIYSRQQARRTAWTNEEVRIWSKQFDGLVLSPIDRNQGDTSVICPILYRHGFAGTVDTEEEILKRSKEDFLKSGLMSIGKWRPDGRLGTAYTIPKHKDLTRWRSIAPAAADPAALAQRRVARALHQLLKRLPANNTFYLDSISELAEKLEGTTQRLRSAGCDSAVGRCYDIKEMFSRIPHGAVLQAVHQLLRIYEDQGCKQIRVSTRGKLCIISENKRKMDGYVSLTLKQIMEGVKFDLRNSVVRSGTKLIRQVFGIPMGKSTSPILASITCAMAELKFVSELRADRKLVGRWRIMDDITIVVGNSTQWEKDEYPENLFEAFEGIYDTNLEIIRKDRCGLTWQFIGGQMMICTAPLQIHYVPTTKNTDSRFETGSLTFQTMQDYNSYSYTAKCVKKAVLTTTLKRLWSQTTSQTLAILMEVGDKALMTKRDVFVRFEKHKEAGLKWYSHTALLDLQCLKVKANSVWSVADVASFCCSILRRGILLSSFDFDKGAWNRL
ncbi:hypothetical protein CBR_g41206 [Chara braunii]|uniref:Reverse transcriptase domain-containing protein n=1 Tax=Chara braunii TaxID=69332 RepID=A0A388K2N8_CHABU|nr:hypothetical protein CBR_g41206 [Chara braunii]|eukprot:GBG64287.1 hypothetical protein CBR_g41206 [Chara braunii]